MIFKLLHLIIMLSKYIFYGVLLQVFCLGMLMAHEGDAQQMSIKETRISLNLKNAHLSQVFTSIEAKTNFRFSYERKDLDNEQTISIDEKEASLEDILMNISQNTNLKFRRINQNIHVSKKKAREQAIAEVSEYLQAISVTGSVTSEEDQQGLPGVNVVVKGTSEGTITDINGNYAIDVPSPSAVLVFSSVGYVSEEVEVGNKSVINLSLIPDITSLAEVVVIGYGSVKKSDVTGAVTSVSAETIQERPVRNALEAMQGKAAGVNISTNIRPGEVPNVSIRGTRSIRSSGESAAFNSPLYVVDGIPISSILDVNSFSLNDLNPNDIASIEILKDASATAIYGSRGANGVILITTKKGSKGRTSVSYNTTVSLDSYKQLTDWMDGGQYIDRWRQSLMNGGLYETAQFTDHNSPVIPGYPDPFEDAERMGLSQDVVARESVWMGYEWEEFGVTPRMRNTTAEEQAMGWPAQVPIYNSKNIRSHDWANDATRQGVTQNHQIGLNAGTENSRLYLSLGYFDQLGVQKDQDFKRYTANINGDITPNRWLTLGTSIIGSFSMQNFGVLPPNTSNTGPKDLYSRALDQFPFAQPKDENGNWIRNAGGNLNLWNPLVDIDQATNERRSTSVLSNTFAEIKFTPWLKYRGNYGMQYRNFRRGSWTGPEATNHLSNRPNTAGYNTEENTSWIVENLLYVDKTFGGTHNIGLTLLQSAQHNRRENVNTNVSNTIYDISYWYDLGANTNGRPDGYGTGFTENALMSYMGRLNYTLNDKYLLTATGRFDGASVLAPGHKWDFFPSFSIAWKMQNEAFMSGLSWVNELKPRFGYGVVGNSSVRPYLSSGPLSRNPYVFGDSPAIGYLPQLVQNPLLGWEKTAQWNFGIDYTLLRGRIAGSVEIYNQNTYDILMEKALPAVSGYVTKWENIGKTRNRGVEITLSTVNVETPNFSWTTDINWASNREEIIELLNGKEDMIAQRWFIGQPVQVYFQYENDGIWGNSAEDLEEMAKFNENGHRFHPGTIKVVDQLTVDSNGDGVPDERDYRITGDDMVVRGSRQPKWYGGITNTLRYKNWSLSAFVYARIGQTYFGGYPNSYGGAWPNGRVENDVWSFENQGGRWPMPNFGNVENITAAMQYHSGSFVSVRHITLAYYLPKQMLEKIGVNDVQISLQAINPFIFGGEIVKMGINPDDDTDWERASSNTNPLGGMNNNTILPQSYVLGIRANF